jgi:mannose-6-phosphate isomerase-like protein (cupin superfamily)
LNIIKVSDLAIAPNPHGVDARMLYDVEKIQIVYITLKPGEGLKRHVTFTDVLFYVLEGCGVVEIGDERKEVCKDTLIESPAGIPHCWYNESDKDLRFLVIKVPRPKNRQKYFKNFNFILIILKYKSKDK